MKQQPSNDLNNPDEFVFCSLNPGPWGCVVPTKKTKISNAPRASERPQRDRASEQAAGPITSSVKNTIANLTANNLALNAVSEDAEDLPLRGEKSIPKSLPMLTVYFDFDSAVLTPGAKLALIDVLDDLQGKLIEIHGFTDDIGPQQHNNLLGQRRAEAVLAFLENSLPKASLSAFGHGLCCYKVANDTEEQRAVNRRVEIYAAEGKG